MSYEFYKILHITGLILTFFGLAGVLFVGMSKGEFKGSVKKWAFITHGTGLLLIFVSGFGLAARLGLVRGLPNWIYAKLAIWVLLGLAISLVKRKHQIGWPLIILLVGLGTTAATIAITKPF